MPLPTASGQYSLAPREEVISPQGSPCFALPTCTRTYIHAHTQSTHPRLQEHERGAKALMRSLLWAQPHTRHGVNRTTYGPASRFCPLATSVLQKLKLSPQMLWEQTQGQCLRRTQNHAAPPGCRRQIHLLFLGDTGWRLSELEAMPRQTQQLCPSHPPCTS